MADCNDDIALAGVSIGGEIVPTTNVPGVGEVAEIACPDDGGPVTDPVFPDTPDCACAVRRLCPIDDDGELIEWWILCEQDGRCKWRPNMDVLLADCCIETTVHEFGFSGNTTDNLSGLAAGDSSDPVGPLEFEVGCDGDYQVCGILDFFPDLDGDRADILVEMSADGGASWFYAPTTIGKVRVCLAEGCSTRLPICRTFQASAGAVVSVLFRVTNASTNDYGPNAYYQVRATAETSRLVCS